MRTDRQTDKQTDALITILQYPTGAEQQRVRRWINCTESLFMRPDTASFADDTVSGRPILLSDPSLYYRALPPSNT